MKAELESVQKKIEKAELETVEKCAQMIEKLVKESGLPENKFGKVIESAAKLLGYGRVQV